MPTPLLLTDNGLAKKLLKGQDISDVFSGNRFHLHLPILKNMLRLAHTPKECDILVKWVADIQVNHPRHFLFDIFLDECQTGTDQALKALWDHARHQWDESSKSAVFGSLCTFSRLPLIKYILSSQEQFNITGGISEAIEHQNHELLTLLVPHMTPPSQTRPMSSCWKVACSMTTHKPLIFCILSFLSRPPTKMKRWSSLLKKTDRLPLSS